MSEKMYPIPFRSLMNWVVTEYSGCGDVFGVHKQYHATGKSLPVPEDCGACRWYALCRGGCRRDRDYFENGIGRNYYCAAYRAFFEYAYPRLVQLYRFMTMPGRI